MYTRQVGTKFDNQGQSASIRPTSQNKILIATEPPEATSGVGRKVRRLLASGHWAAGVVKFEGIQCLLSCDKLPEEVASCNRHTGHAKVKITDVDESKCAKNPFMGCEMIPEGSSISFGMKVMHEKWNEERGGMDFWGFHFVKLEIP